MGLRGARRNPANPQMKELERAWGWVSLMRAAAEATEAQPQHRADGQGAG